MDIAVVISLIYGLAAGAWLVLLFQEHRRPWLAQYIESNLREADCGDARGACNVVFRWIFIDPKQSRKQKQLTLRHEVAHQCLSDLSLALDQKEEETLADLIAYSMTALDGEAPICRHSFSESDEPGLEQITLNQAFSCVNLAFHLHSNSRQKEFTHEI